MRLLTAGGCTELRIPASGTQAKGELWSPDSETVHQFEDCYFPSALGGHAAGMRVSATAVLRRSRKCVEKGTSLGRGAVIPGSLFFSSSKLLWELSYCVPVTFYWS